jgi:hypothetical protein
MISSAYIPEHSGTTTSADRRQDERYEIPIDVQIDVISNDGSVFERVPALVINISRSGACLITDVTVHPGTFIVLQMVHETFYTSALVIDAKQAGGAVKRLHVQFVGSQWAPADQR